MKFLGQCFQKLEPELNTNPQTRRQTRKAAHNRRQ